MHKRIKVAFVGGGSFNWAPKILKDIMMKEELGGIDFYLLDRQLPNAEKIKRLGEKMNSDLAGDHRFFASDDENESFTGCDFVIICIATPAEKALEAMRQDVQIPEKYGIYQPVGDTVGPGGWSRNLRNVPVFNDLARKIAELSNDAVVLNYTNPMACLTKAFYAQTNLRAVGLCHGLFECYRVLQAIFGLESEKQIDVKFAGVNHFFWILDFKVNGQDGYRLLEEKLGDDKRFVDLIQEVHSDEMGFASNKYLTSQLYETFGCLPYVGDRHTCEFFPHVITGDADRLHKYRISRTTIDERQARLVERETEVDAMIAGTQAVNYSRSRETAADILEAMALGKEFIDVVNVPNQGQIPSLPLGGVVETLGVVNTLGFTPICTGPLPEPINNLLLPHVKNAETLYQAATHGDFPLALESLYQDPTCAHLDYDQIRSMAEELMQANREFLPQFFR